MMNGRTRVLQSWKIKKNGLEEQSFDATKNSQTTTQREQGSCSLERKEANFTAPISDL
jgi:hypothetical protein